jgi:hypothetical protein
LSSLATFVYVEYKRPLYPNTVPCLPVDDPLAFLLGDNKESDGEEIVGEKEIAEAFAINWRMHGSYLRPTMWSFQNRVYRWSAPSVHELMRAQLAKIMPPDQMKAHMHTLVNLGGPFAASEKWQEIKARAMSAPVLMETCRYPLPRETLAKEMMHALKSEKFVVHVWKSLSEYRLLMETEKAKWVSELDYCLAQAEKDKIECEEGVIAEFEMLEEEEKEPGSTRFELPIGLDMAVVQNVFRGEMMRCQELIKKRMETPRLPPLEKMEDE